VSTAYRSAPTRHELRRVARRLERVRTASALLLRKRRALVTELFRMAGAALDARQEIEVHAVSAAAALRHAEGAQGHPLLRALGLPAREIEVALRPTETWGVASAEIVDHTPVRRSVVDRAMAAGSAGPAVAAAAERFEILTERVLEAASREILIRRLARALEETSRRVNLLERRVGPALAGEIRRIEATLEEREREDQLRYRRLSKRPSDS
jgi:V/A-type H+/Na+-transporting ATPase subunit D